MSVSQKANIGLGVFLWHRELSNIGACEIGAGCNIHSHVWIGDGVKIGKRVSIQAFSFIPEGVEIGDDAFIGPRVTFTNDKYPPSDRSRWLKTKVCRGAKIGASATIVCGVTIGENATIGASACVTKDVPAGETWVGVPARPVRVEAVA